MSAQPQEAGFLRMLGERPLGEVADDYPVVNDFFMNLNLPALDMRKTLAGALADVGDEWLEEFGLTAHEIPAQLAQFLAVMSATEDARAVPSLTIVGGHDKLGEPEEARLTLVPGQVVSIVGPTGSGKSRLLGDIECLAQGDTPTGRVILVGGEPVGEDDRFRLEGKVVAQLSQNMNFVMDLTCAEFLETHARSRNVPAADIPGIVARCYDAANRLAGERFEMGTKVTQLSGGQSRALMIADVAYMSQSPVVLIDEIENAGVDRREAIALLAREDKIVLVSTHDPLLALDADKRIVIKNGGIFKVLDTMRAEKRTLAELDAVDRMLQDARARLRRGERVVIWPREGGDAGAVAFMDAGAGPGAGPGAGAYMGADAGAYASAGPYMGAGAYAGDDGDAEGEFE